MKMSENDKESHSVEETGELSGEHCDGELNENHNHDSNDHYEEEADNEFEEEINYESDEETNDELNEEVNFETSEEEMDESTEKNKEHENYFSEHLPGLLVTIKECEQEVEVKSLYFVDYRLSVSHLDLILDFLQTSRISELSVEECGSLKNGMTFVADKLKKTKLSKLSIAYCDLVDSDILSVARVLEHTQITELNINRVFEECTEEWVEEFVSNLHKSHLTSLKMRGCRFFMNGGAISFTDFLASSAITHLDISSTLQSSAGLIFLFAILPNTSITELILNHNKITDIELRALSQTLRRSKLELLYLESNLISDAGVALLAKNLVSSKVTDLSLADNKFSDGSSIVHHLKYTNIKTLNLGFNYSIGSIFSSQDFLRDSDVSTLLLRYCRLGDVIGENVIRSLKYSKITTLNLELNNFGLRTISEFANVLQDTNIIDIILSENCIPAEGFHILGESLKHSKIQYFRLSKNSEISAGPKAFAVFIEKTKGSKINVLDISRNPFQKSGIEIIAKSLINTTFTHLNLSGCSIGDGIVNLAACLKYTAITHLELSSNKIRDKGAEALSKSLGETQISMLDVSKNSITNNGAKSLTSCLRDTSLYVLKLWGNKVDNQGIEDLAKIIEGTFVTYFDIKSYQIRKYLVINTVLWKNKVSVHKLLKFFKKIAPETGCNCFCFARNLDPTLINEFLDECLHFYKTANEHPSAISAIAQDKTLSLTRKQVTKLLVEEFPRQLTSFIGSKIEADVFQHVHFLVKAEAMGLNNLVELLLLNRPVLTIDEEKSILHPKVYLLLYKYKQPIFNLNIEPEGRNKILKYFTDHEDLEGAADVIKIVNMVN